LSVVWKFAVPRPNANGRAFIDAPAVVEFLCAGIQGDEIVVWALVEPGEHEPGYLPSGPHRLIVLNTGQEVSGFPEGAKFLGTVTTSNGIVWHVWDGDAETTA
jgi:hypothetical protein